MEEERKDSEEEQFFDASDEPRSYDSDGEEFVDTVDDETEEIVVKTPVHELIEKVNLPLEEEKVAEENKSSEFIDANQIELETIENGHNIGPIENDDQELIDEVKLLLEDMVDYVAEILVRETLNAEEGGNKDNETEAESNTAERRTIQNVMEAKKMDDGEENNEIQQEVRPIEEETAPKVEEVELMDTTEDFVHRGKASERPRIHYDIFRLIENDTITKVECSAEEDRFFTYTVLRSYREAVDQTLENLKKIETRTSELQAEFQYINCRVELLKMSLDKSDYKEAINIQFDKVMFQRLFADIDELRTKVIEHGEDYVSQVGHFKKNELENYFETLRKIDVRWMKWKPKVREQIGHADLPIRSLKAKVTNIKLSLQDLMSEKFFKNTDVINYEVGVRSVIEKVDSKSGELDPLLMPSIAEKLDPMQAPPSENEADEKYYIVNIYFTEEENRVLEWSKTRIGEEKGPPGMDEVQIMIMSFDQEFTEIKSKSRFGPTMLNVEIPLEKLIRMTSKERMGIFNILERNGFSLDTNISIEAIQKDLKKRAKESAPGCFRFRLPRFLRRLCGFRCSSKKKVNRKPNPLFDFYKPRDENHPKA